MNQLKALLWKEWREIRVFFFIALFVFLGLPLLGAIESKVQTGRFEIMASVWAYFLGGVFAIFVGVGTVVRDMKGRLEDFWRSRPVSLSRWLLTKYFVGLAVVIVTLVAPLVLELLVNQTQSDLYASPQLVLAWHPFVWAVLYSVGFMMACLVRRGAHAAMLSIAVMLLLYFLPDVLPPLRHLSVSWAVEESALPRRDDAYNILPYYHGIPWTLGKVVFHPAQLQFAMGMVLLCVAAVVGAFLIVRRDARVESGRKTIYWSLGGAALILFTSASFQIATNLQLLQTVRIPDREWVQGAYGNAEHAMFVTEQWTPKDPSDPNAPQSPLYRIHPFRVTSAGIELGEPTELGKDFWWQYALWQPERPNVLYGIRFGPEGNYLDEHFPVLVTAQLGIPAAKVTEQPFPKLLTNNNDGIFRAQLYTAGNRMYLVFGPHLLVFDISDPLGPKVVSERTIDVGYARFDPSFDNERSDLTIVPLPQIPGLSARQRLEVRAARWPTFDGNVLTRVHNDRIFTFKIDALTDTAVTFRRVGRYEPTPVQKLFGAGFEGAASGNGLYYQAFRNSRFGGFRLSVFDVHDPQRPSPIAHIAFPGGNYERHLLPLADGRLVACGQYELWHELWLISAPPRRE
jgi:ABC-type transport system involved in multi-copper enzyme maturation permease subunit